MKISDNDYYCFPFFQMFHLIFFNRSLIYTWMYFSGKAVTLALIQQMFKIIIDTTVHKKPW